jgi:adenylate kinase
LAFLNTNHDSTRKSKVILVTGPPLNGRDQYLRSVIDILCDLGQKVGYHYVFEEMQIVARSYGISNLTRANVLSVPSETLNQIRSSAFSNIAEALKTSTNDIEFISSPGTFRIRPSPPAPSGRMNGLELTHLKLVRPDLVAIVIADLLEARTALRGDPVWNDRVDGSLKTLAEWRRESIDLIEKDASDWSLSESRFPLDYVIFGKAHSPKTLAELCIGKKPRIYISFAITDAPGNETKVAHVRKKLEEHFVCLDPYAIKDWEIIYKFDQSVEEGKNEILIPHAGQTLSKAEVDSAIDDIRAQTVTRDYSLVRHAHATVVVHLTKQPSYGVMSEIIETRASYNPVYVIYPFKSRPSPFFEYYASSENIVRNEDLDACISALVEKMNRDIASGLWLRWKSP